MIGEILQAVIDECKSLNTEGTNLLKTDYKMDKLLTYSMPLCLIDLLSAPESEQMIGGATKMDWDFAIKVYHYEPNAYLGEDGGYSTSLLNILDTFRQHFSMKIWNCDSMAYVVENYGIKFTFLGINNAEPIDPDGLKMGYAIGFGTVAFDLETLPEETKSVTSSILATNVTYGTSI